MKKTLLLISVISGAVSVITSVILMIIFGEEILSVILKKIEKLSRRT